MKKYVHIALIMAFLIVGLGACKNKEKIAAEAEKERIEQEAKQLRSELSAILADTNLTADELDEKLETYRKMDIKDAQAASLLEQAEQLLKEKRKAEAELQEKQEHKEVNLTEDLYAKFAKIAGAGNYDLANKTINEALQLFESDNALVLIILYRQNDVVDYDKPTTAIKYLNYLKDQKKNPHKIDEIVEGSKGKIKELILISDK